MKNEKRFECIEPFTHVDGEVKRAFVMYAIGSGERRAISYRAVNTFGPIIDEVLGNVGIVRQAILARNEGVR